MGLPPTRNQGRKRVGGRTIGTRGTRPSATQEGARRPLNTTARPLPSTVNPPLDMDLTLW